MSAESNVAASTVLANASTSVGSTNHAGPISLGGPPSACAGQQQPKGPGDGSFINTLMPADSDLPGIAARESVQIKPDSDRQSDGVSEEYSNTPTVSDAGDVPATACVNIVLKKDPWMGIHALDPIPGTGYTRAVFTSPVPADRKLEHVAVGQVCIYKTDDKATAISYNIRVYAKVDGKPFVKVWGANPNKIVATEKTIDITEGTTPTDIVTKSELVTMVEASAMKGHSETFYNGVVGVMNDIMRQYGWKE